MLAVLAPGLRMGSWWIPHADVSLQCELQHVQAVRHAVHTYQGRTSVAAKHAAVMPSLTQEDADSKCRARLMLLDQDRAQIDSIQPPRVLEQPGQDEGVTQGFMACNDTWSEAFVQMKLRWP